MAIDFDLEYKLQQFREVQLDYFNENGEKYTHRPMDKETPEMMLQLIDELERALIKTTQIMDSEKRQLHECFKPINFEPKKLKTLIAVTDGCFNRAGRVISEAIELAASHSKDINLINGILGPGFRAKSVHIGVVTAKEINDQFKSAVMAGEHLAIKANQASDLIESIRILKKQIPINKYKHKPHREKYTKRNNEKSRW